MTRAGLDPEFFVVDGNNNIIPAHLFIPDPASKPYTTHPVGYDNAAVEIRPKPTGCHAALITNTREILWQAVAMQRLARFRGTISPNSRISLAPAARLRHDAMAKHGEILSIFGCSPSSILSSDLTIDSNLLAPDPAQPWRSAGFHIHFSNPYRYGPGQPSAHRNALIAKDLHIMDSTLGLVDVLMNESLGYSAVSRVRRMELGYGKPGEHRFSPTTSRLEYRTLSPWVLAHPMLTWWATTAVRSCTQVSDYIDIFRLAPRSDVMHAITHNSPVMAWNLLLHNLNALYGPNGMLLPGTVSVIPDDYNSGIALANMQWILTGILAGGVPFFTRTLSMPKPWFDNHRLETNRIIHKLRTHMHPASGITYLTRSARHAICRERKSPAGRRYINLDGCITHDKGYFKTFDGGMKRFSKIFKAKPIKLASLTPASYHSRVSA